MQGSHSGRRSAVRSGLLTGLSTAAVSGSAALAGAILSRKFGHGVETDGFFAAYFVYVAVVLVASALRVVVLPEFARAQEAGKLGREVGSWALALALPLVPLAAVAIAAPHWVAGLLTSNSQAQASAASLLPWLIPAAVLQVYAGISASALAALDDYGTAALGYGVGAVAGLVVIGSMVDHGVQAFGWGLALNGALAVGIPLVRLARRRGVGRPGGAVGARLRRLVEGVALPFAIQGLYIVSYRFASGLGSGKPTTLSYAYLISSLLVAVTATSVALVSSVPLSRGSLTPERSARHIVSASWLSLVVVAGAAGVLALAGAPVAKLALGSSYGGTTGTELGRLVAYLAFWMTVSVAFSVAFPLLFVLGRARHAPAARRRGASGAGADRVGRKLDRRPRRDRSWSGDHHDDHPRRPAPRARRPRRHPARTRRRRARLRTHGGRRVRGHVTPRLGPSGRSDRLRRLRSRARALAAVRPPGVVGLPPRPSVARHDLPLG